nr:conserved hypothetical protein [uncultured archaeon]
MSDIKNFERNKYFYGKLMTVRDFETEQSYFIEKQRLINRLIHGAGVVCGLKVEETREWTDIPEKIKINPGVAIDCCGREIIVPEEKVVDLKEEYSPDDNEETVYVLLKYDFCEKESVPVINNVSACEETCCYNRILETYKIEISKDMPEDCVPSDGRLCDVWSDTEKPEKFVDYWIKECPECPQEPAVLLAAISLQNSTIKKIDNAIKDGEGFKKSLVFSNARLYELIKCVEKKVGLEKDLPCITGISWEHDREYDLSNPSDMEELRELMLRYTITFNKDIKKETINHKTLNGILLEYIFVEHYNDCGYVEQTSAKSNLPVCFFPEEAKDKVSFTFFPGISGIGNVGYWAVNNMIKTRIKTAYKSRVTMGITTGEVKVQNVGMRILIQLKGDFVLDENGYPLDANFLKGVFLTGNGIPGGLFESWFDVKFDYSKVDNAKKVISNKPGSTTEEVATSTSLSRETAYFILEAMAKNNVIYYKEGKYYPLPDPAKTMIVYDAKYNYMRISAKELKDNLGDEGIIAKIKSSDELTDEDKNDYEIISLRGRDITGTTKEKMRGIESKLNWSKSTGDTEIVKSPYIKDTNVFIVGGKDKKAVDKAVSGFLENYTIT